jgi:transketolase
MWEAASFANKYKLKNLINIINDNGLQIDGSNNQIMPLGSLIEKYIEFGWNTMTINGHDPSSIKKALESAKKSDKPTCIIAKTILGKGISYMENNYQYHDVKGLSEELYEQARRELK